MVLLRLLSASSGDFGRAQALGAGVRKEKAYIAYIDALTRGAKRRIIISGVVTCVCPAQAGMNRLVIKKQTLFEHCCPTSVGMKKQKMRVLTKIFLCTILLSKFGDKKIFKCQLSVIRKDI